MATQTGTIYAAAISKGGTGKTTTAVTLAQAAAHTGSNVLLIDLDPQANATIASGADPDGAAISLMAGKYSREYVQHTGSGVHVIAAAPDLAAVKLEAGSAIRAREAIRQAASGYDLTIIDTPPTSGALQYTALYAADGVIIPMQADMFSLNAMRDIV